MDFMDIIIFHDLIAATYLHSVFSEVITFLWLAPIFKSQRWQWSQCNHVIDEVIGREFKSYCVSYHGTITYPGQYT